MDVHEQQRSRTERGSSLASLLLVIVVLGALTAAVIVGVSTMTGTNTGSGVLSATTSTARSGVVKKTSVSAGRDSRSIEENACKASAAAAGSASSLYLANSGGRYPVKWTDLTASTPPVYQLATNVVINAGNPTELDGNGWTLTMAGGGTTVPIFTCG